MTQIIVIIPVIVNVQQRINENDYEEKTEDATAESKDFSEEVYRSEFNKDNIDFKDLKDKLNKDVFDDTVLTDNTIRHIKETINSNIEVQWETGVGNKIVKKIKGEKSSVNPSTSLKERSDRNVKTPQITHNHTSGIPLPHPEDMVNLLDLKIVNSTIPGNYGVLNMKNSFRKFDDTIKNSLEKEANNMFENLDKKALDNRSRKNLPKELIRKGKYKYYKSNINDIVDEYNKQFNKYGIKFDFTPFNLK